MICFGEYEKKYYKGGLLFLPSQWINEKNQSLYCAMCREKDRDSYFLRFFLCQEEIKKYIKIESQDAYFEILQCSRHRIFPFGKMIMLPKEFCKKGIGQRHELACLGIGNGFEVWHAKEYHKMQNELDEELQDLLDNINWG